MILTAPYSLTGETGKSLGASAYSLTALNIQSATLTLKSLDVDTLTFAIRAKTGNIIPADEQWLTLTDSLGVVLFKGLTKRTYTYRTRIYSYVVSSAYKGLLEVPLTDSSRAFVLYGAQDLGTILTNLLARATTAGLPLQGPGTLPAFFAVPKMAFRAASCGGAVEDALKWAPDTVTRCDYTTSPPTLRFYCRGQTAATTINLDSATHHATDVTLTPFPEARALAVAFAYAQRDGDNIVLYQIQRAGDDTAEARRKISLYLSGHERSDMLVSEALTTAQKAVAMAQAAVTAVGASVDAAAASAQIPLTWAGLVGKDTNLTAAANAQPGFTMSGGGSTYTLYTGIVWGSGTASGATNSLPTAQLALRTSAGALATGWYPIQSGAFTAAQLATAGATKETRYIRGDFVASRNFTGSNAGMNSLSTGAASTTSTLEGYTAQRAASEADSYNYYQKILRTGVNISVDAIDKSPAAVAAAVKAAAASGSSSLITRAEFVTAPPNLAANYFARQNWTPYKGTLLLSPNAADFPGPGTFLNIGGTDAPAEWASMAAPVSALEIDLRTGAASVTVGPAPRMDFSSLIDRLRIPPEDNYEPG